MATIQRWGNSLAVRIPAALAGQIEVTAGTDVELSVQDGTLLIKPKGRPTYRLADLLVNCKPSQLHGELDLGPDVGREIID